MADPMEEGFKNFCLDNNIAAVPHDAVSGLDFYLPDYDCYVEVKQFHSDRIAKQMSKRDNVIAIQGKGALECFKKMMQP